MVDSFHVSNLKTISCLNKKKIAINIEKVSTKINRLATCTKKDL